MVATSDIVVHDVVVRALAFVNGRDPSEILKEIADADGDLEIDSKRGQVVAICVEHELAQEGMIRLEDQRKETLTSTRSLEAMIAERLKARGIECA